MAYFQQRTDNIKNQWNAPSKLEVDVQREAAPEMTYQDIVASRHMSGLSVADLVQKYAGNRTVQPWEEFLIRIINREQSFREYSMTQSSENKDIIRESFGLEGHGEDPLVTPLMTNFLDRMRNQGTQPKRLFVLTWAKMQVAQDFPVTKETMTEFLSQVGVGLLRGPDASEQVADVEEWSVVVSEIAENYKGNEDILRADFGDFTMNYLDLEESLQTDSELLEWVERISGGVADGVTMKKKRSGRLAGQPSPHHKKSPRSTKLETLGRQYSTAGGFIPSESPSHLKGPTHNIWKSSSTLPTQRKLSPGVEQDQNQPDPPSLLRRFSSQFLRIFSSEEEIPQKDRTQPGDAAGGPEIQRHRQLVHGVETEVVAHHSAGRRESRRQVSGIGIQSSSKICCRSGGVFFCTGDSVKSTEIKSTQN